MRLYRAHGQQHIVTETEEKYERKEVISYSGNKEFMKYVHMDVLDFSYHLRGICNRRARSNHTIFP